MLFDWTCASSGTLAYILVTVSNLQQNPMNFLDLTIQLSYRHFVSLYLFVVIGYHLLQLSSFF